MESREIKVPGGTSVTSNGFFIIPDLTFETDGKIFQIEGDFKQVGSLNILVSDIPLDWLIFTFVSCRRIKKTASRMVGLLVKF